MKLRYLVVINRNNDTLRDIIRQCCDPGSVIQKHKWDACHGRDIYNGHDIEYSTVDVHTDMNFLKNH